MFIEEFEVLLFQARDRTSGIIRHQNIELDLALRRTWRRAMGERGVVLVGGLGAQGGIRRHGNPPQQGSGKNPLHNSGIISLAPVT